MCNPSLSSLAPLARPAPATLDDMLGYAQAVWGVGEDEGLEAQIALAWALRNRAAFAAQHCAATGHRHAEFGDGAIGAACREYRAGARHPGFEDPRFCRALAAACLVWSGDIADPVHGATRFHSHRDDPRWADGRAAVALIGDQFFYRDLPSKHHAPLS